MIWTTLFVISFSINMSSVELAKLDMIKCGVDDSETVEGLVPNERYPWLGVLFYTMYGGLGEMRSVTTVVLIHEEFVVGNSADIGPMPKQVFRDVARVLLGEGWERFGRRVRNYVIHPEYGETINSVALIHLRQPVRDRSIIKPICPAPERVRFPKFWVVKFEEKLDNLQKRVLPVEHVPAHVCRDFYKSAHLDDPKRRPSYVRCAVCLETPMPCVWGAGAALVTRDVWGRWQLLGLSVHGAGCGAPSRHLDMLRYYPWIEDALSKFQRITISQINDHKYVLRSGSRTGSLMKFGECDEGERMNLIYRDSVDLSTDNNNVKLIKYNMTIYDSVQYTCLTFELLHASASAEMRVRHFCPRQHYGPACYSYRGTRFDISVDVLFTEACRLDVRAWGEHVNISLLDIQAWKWEEGTYYEDFKLEHVEYRGPAHMTQFGFEPLDERMWVPDYDRWSTVPPDRQTSTQRKVQEGIDDPYSHALGVYDYNASATERVTTTTTTKRPFRRKTPPPTYWQKHQWDNLETLFEQLGTEEFWMAAGSEIEKGWNVVQEGWNNYWTG